MKRNNYKVVIVDDHKLFREGLKYVINQMENLEVVAEASNGNEFLDILKKQEVDLVLMDISMPHLDGIQATKMATTLYPGIRILAISMFCDQEYYYQMVHAGVMGFVLKESGTNELEEAIKSVLKGETFFSQKLLMDIIVNFQPPGKEKKIYKDQGLYLTKRESEILKLLCEGYSNTQIAEKLFISQRTVEGHKSNLINKTGVKNTIGLVMYALKNNLVSIP